jgi:hypothetical protein
MKRVLYASGIALAVVAACSSSDDTQAITLTGQALQDPNNCLPCHQDQFREWSGSMHAYASEDPVFRAMNKRMIRETNGASKDLCVGCHAPVALRLGLTTDGQNLSELPTAVQGVTCYFCHTVDSVGDTHNNNPLHLANDDTLRGGITNPVKSMPHKGTYSTLHDRENHDSATLCGACHDVVTTHGAHVERTFEEWKSSLYAQPNQLSCGKCHMDGREGKASQTTADAPMRKVHDHSMAAVDIALTPFFGADAQRELVQRTLDNSILTQLCVQRQPTGVMMAVTLDNAFAGHGFPSGAAQDRRVWVELHAFKGGAELFSTGTVGDKQAASAYTDPNYWLLRDTIFDDSNKETHLFWQAARFESEQLPPAVTSDPLDPRFIHSKTRNIQLAQMPDRVTMKVRMRPLDYDLLDDLVTSGDLDPAVRDAAPVFELASGAKEWTPEKAISGCVK